jgi:hypothetical protein
MPPTELLDGKGKIMFVEVHPLANHLVKNGSALPFFQV